LCEGRRKRGSDNSLLLAVVEVNGKRRHARPVGIGKIVVTVNAPVEVAALLVKAQAPAQLARDPDIYIAAVGPREYGRFAPGRRVRRWFARRTGAPGSTVAI
jgi:hypothetical protein